jgi:murein DD-endopeptidase MepM/ murein hydrolase activator NlpD
LFHPRRLSYAPDLYVPQIEALFEEYGSTLATRRFGIGHRSQSFAEVLVGLSSLYSLNPGVLLALIEAQSSLISDPNPGTDQVAWAVGYRGDGGGRRGLYGQLRWAAREMRYALVDYSLAYGGEPAPLRFADGSELEVGADLPLSRYVLARLLAPTTTPDQLGPRMDRLVNTYARLFGDPREPPLDWPAPAEPFLHMPMEAPMRVTSFFDHDTPFLRENGSTHTFWGRAETDMAFAYDGHTGWDYAMAPPDRVLAAADGMVVFAGNSDDGCATPSQGVIIDHGNGYRTLYWHLARIDVELGQPVVHGDVLGIAGDSGCAFGAHLHLQVQYLGRDVDPYGWCGSEPDPWALKPAGAASHWLWVDMPSPCEPPAPEIIVVDDADPGFVARGAWQRHAIGYGGGAHFAATTYAGSSAMPWRAADLAAPLVVAWQPELPAAGRYRVLAYVPYALNGLDETHEMRYLVRHSTGEDAVAVDAEQLRNWWVDLGTYDFDPQSEPLVSLSTLAGDARRGVWADAVAFVPVP